MRIVHLSFAPVVPAVTDPNEWLERISFLTGVMEAMAKKAEVLGVFHIDFKGTIKKNSVTFHFTGYKRRHLMWPTKLNHFLSGLKPDVVIIHGLVFPFQILMLRRTLGATVKILCQHHAERPFRDFRRYLQKLADNAINAYLFSSLTQGAEWVNAGQINDERKVHQVMGTSSPFESKDRSTLRNVTGVAGDPVYVWVGALNDNKDPVTLIRGFMKYLASAPRASLYLIYQTDQLEPDIRLMLGEKEPARQIHLVGGVARHSISDWLNSADFIISTSHYEGSGIAVCEGMSCGCIPLLTDIPSFRMMTDNGNVGLLFEAGNADSLHDALMKSKKFSIPSERTRTLSRFKNELSFAANARKIFKVIHQ
jgi:glycosyltransferase involved in cell wall biosynthesis